VWCGVVVSKYSCAVVGEKMRPCVPGGWELRPKRGGTFFNLAPRIVHVMPGFSLLFHMRVCVVLKREDKIKRLLQSPTSLEGV
jgi:hypothetical protein